MSCQPPQPTKFHQWLMQLVGSWQFESVAEMGPDQPPMKATGRETVRAIGDLWIVAEGEGEMPGGGLMKSVMTLGYDPLRAKFVGTWIGSPMAHMFVYEGELADAAGNTPARLPLTTLGPSFADPTKMATYQDVLELHPDGQRMLYAQLLGDDGNWQQFMTATYRRA